MGGNLTKADEWTTSLLTNREVLAVDQHSRENRPVVSTEDLVIWTARPESGSDFYIAVFNLRDTTQTVHYLWKDVGLPSARYGLRDLWEHKDLGRATELTVTLAPHASVLYRAAFQ
jgi:hypothetical protein